MESKVAAANHLIKDLNSFPNLFTSMTKLSMEKYLDTDKMIFVPFNAKKILWSEGLVNDYYIFLKKEELEKIEKLFSETINDAYNEYREGKLSVKFVHEILDLIEGVMPDVKFALEDLANKVPAISKNVNEFILLHKENMRIANSIFIEQSYESNQSNVHVNLPKNQVNNEVEKRQQQLLNSSFELSNSMLLLQSQRNSFDEKRVKTTQEIKQIEEDIAVRKINMSIHNSTLNLSRTNAKEALGLAHVKVEISDEDLLDHLGEHMNALGYKESLHNLINEIKTSLEFSDKIEQMMANVQVLQNELYNFEICISETSTQLSQMEIEHNKVKNEIQVLNLKL